MIDLIYLVVKKSKTKTNKYLKYWEHNKSGEMKLRCSIHVFTVSSLFLKKEVENILLVFIGNL